MNERPEITDDGITAMLETRAGLAKTDGLLASVSLAAARIPQRRTGRLGFGLLRGSVGASLAGAASLVLLVLALAVAFGSHIPGVASPSDRPSVNGSAPASASAQPPATPVAPVAAGPVLPLTVDELNALLATDLNGLIGRRLVITGSIRGVSADCFNSTACPSRAVLVGSDPQLEVKSIPAEVALAGGTTFSAVLIDPRTLGYEATVTAAAGGAPLMPSQLVAIGTATGAHTYWLVQGWIVARPRALACPQAPQSPYDGPQYTCAGLDVLSDSEFLPSPSAPFAIPSDGIRVQNGAFDHFAPVRSSPGAISRPEQATFLVQAVYTSPCPPGEFCAFSSPIRGWQIIARLDPWPESTAVPPPEPSNGTAIAVRPLTADQLNLFMRMNSQSPSGRQLVITGTIERRANVVVLSGSDPVLEVTPIGDRGPGPWDVGGASLTGTFAAMMADGFLLDYQGPVSTALNGDAWLPSELPVPSASTAAAGYRLVHGWIGGPSIAPSCPFVQSSPYQGPQYTCGGIITLRDSPIDFNSGAVRVQNDAYEAFAPSPTQGDSGTQPEQATFLVKVFQVPRCGPTADCMVYAGDYHWQIVARVGPWPFPTTP